VAVDRGGCVETTHATTYSYPTYEIDGVVHYRIANMLGAVRKSRALQYGLNTLRGFVTYPTVAMRLR
jgi:alanine dehydrogenase